MRYGISYLDMYDYGESWSGPEFTTANDALAHAKGVLDDFLQGALTAGMTAEELHGQFMMFGEDVVIAPMDGAPSLNFSGRDYVRQRSEELCAISKPAPSPFVANGGGRMPAVAGPPIVDC